jgi:NADPH:quinone reductase-like Zn-dependent oxidoreductase
MQKVVIHRPGGYDRLLLESHPDPEPGPDEVVVRTSAIGVNYADCCVRWGVYESAKEYVGWPITPGFEFAGVVEASRSIRWKLGTRVFGITRFGAYATHVRVPEHQLFEIPKGWNDEQAAAFPSVAMTAYHALFQTIQLRPGMNLLVHSAAGGVGTALLQLGRIAGYRMVGVVGAAHKIQTARAAGAETVIDKSGGDLWEAARRACPEGYDAVFDANGPTTLMDSYRHLRPTGKLVTYGFHGMLPRSGDGSRGRLHLLKAALGWLRIPRFNPLHMTSANKSVVAFNLSFLFERRDLMDEGMGALLLWAAEGKLPPPGVTHYALDRVGEAHAAIESGSTVGKLVLVP